MLDAFGSLLAEHGPHDEAVRVLQQAVVVSPDDGHEKYMCAYIKPQYSYPPACTPTGSRCCVHSRTHAAPKLETLYRLVAQPSPAANLPRMHGAGTWGSCWRGQIASEISSEASRCCAANTPAR